MMNKDALMHFDYFFHHLFLPSKLPGGHDESPERESCLLDFVLESLGLFLDQAGPECHVAIRSAISMMKNMQTARRRDGNLQEGGVREVLQRISSPDTVAPFLLEAQNAGVLVRSAEASVIFELFELSPTNTSVNSTRGRLVRQFPGFSIGVSSGVFSQGAFQLVLAKTLVKMSHQTADETKPKAKKAKQLHAEDRETVDPRIVTELLSSFLRGVGEQVPTTRICKNTREEVLWNNSLLPWRRSALWLLVRISLQLTMDRMGDDFGALYKSFMVFLLARVIDAANQRHTPSDVLQTMAIKVSRRLLKLTHPISGSWLTSVREIMSKTSNCLDERWQQIRKKREPQLDLAALSKLNMVDDVHISLPEMEQFVSSILQDDRRSQSSSFCPISYVELMSAENLPSISTGTENEFHSFRLAMVESWVAAHLDHWIENHLKDESSCFALWTLMRNYHSAARPWYASRPEGASRMFLAILELWVAADKAAVHAIPLLRNYKTEIPAQVYQALLLAFRGDMGRLHRAETYLGERQKYSEPKQTPSIFRSNSELLSFPVQYFWQSYAHQGLMRRIEEWAETKRQQKCEEFRRLKGEYDDLIRRYSEGVCQQIEREEDGIRYTEHAPYCNRHWLLSRARNLSIEVHEWPLSDDVFKAQATVFELDVPSIFGVWRDATLYVIDDVLQSESLSREFSETPYPLRNYDGLADFFQSDPRSRVHLLSSTKPHSVTHRREKRISDTSSESDVCVNNGLHLRYFDNSRGIFLSEFAPSRSLSDLCTFKLPACSQALERFLVRAHTQPAGETPNQVIASQATCPEHMSLGEYKALATLPFGYRIQWMSILTQLAMPEVDFNKAETAIFFLQISLQVGPNYSGKLERCSHSRLSDVEFGCIMLDRLQECISRVKENWESHTALWIFTFLATRLLSMVTNDLKQPLLDFLRQCREVSYKWLSKLHIRIHEATDDDQRIQFRRAGFQICLICADSFNVDYAFLRKILSEPEQSAILVETSINIRNNAQLRSMKKESLETLMYDRWTYTLHRSRPILLEEIVMNDNPCLNLAIKRCWPAFNPELDWHLAPSTCDWVETTSAHLNVHVNILSGELLVDGLPLSRLPREYEAHLDYQRLFGSFVLDVMPSPCLGMKFCSTKTFGGYTVHFNIQNNFSRREATDLLIRLEREESILDFIPPRVFTGLLPHSFIRDYAHWYHRDNKTVEFRPLKSHWNSSSEKWTLSQHGSSWKLTRGGKISLLAPTSNSAQRIAVIFSALDSLLDIHMLFDEANGALEVKFPSLELEFLLNSGESVVRSRQFRGMQIDADQSIGTLVGFTSKLVMQDSENLESRMMLIPEGKVQHSKGSDGHVTAFVTHGTACRVQRYWIDKQLGRLVDNATVQSKLYIAYIHALTSYCIPDPFSGRTGIEEALAILQSASVRSMGYLTQDSMDILQNIAALTPSRSFYPRHLKSMQTVVWSPDLSFLSQDGRFYKIVKEILEEVSELRFLYSSNVTGMDEILAGEIHLVERDILRNSHQQVSGFGAEDFASSHDVVYSPRDCGQNSSRATFASEIAFRVHHGLQSLPHQVSPDLLNQLYTLLSRTDTTPATREMPKKGGMEYDSEWLRDPKTFLPSMWCHLHYAFQHDQLWLNKFQLMMWFTTISYSKENSTQTTQALLMLALSPHVSAAALPQGFSFDLSKGYNAEKGKLQQAIEGATRPLHQCPEANLRPSPGESGQQALMRRNSTLERNKNKAVNAFLGQIIPQWPCGTPIEPHGSPYDTYINGSSAMRAIESKWRVWYANLQFRNYLEELIRRLRDVSVKMVHIPPIMKLARPEAPCRPSGFISADDLFSNTPQFMAPILPQEFDALARTRAVGDEASNKLAEVLDFLDSQAKLEYERRYLTELRHSLLDLQARITTQLKEDTMSTKAMLLEVNLQRCKMHVQQIYDLLSQAVSPSTNVPSSNSQAIIQAIATDAKFRPRISPTFFLQQLGRSRWSRLSKPWKDSIIAYGMSITTLQQAQRLVQIQDKEVDFLREIENIGHKSWDPYKYPEWLLLECESGIIIREVQQQIAEQMITPPGNENAVMQLNMGEGKSSVIVPIVAAALSNGSQLVRVIVAKPQAKQMYQMLVSKLSGLLDRPIYQMPFSRAVRMSIAETGVIRKLVTQCMAEGGIMMVQPEHLLSFQLMGLECQINENSEVANSLLEIQRFLDNSSRDIVDESDENFSVKFELIYTIGQQRPIEFTPDRWVVIQEVLAKFAEFAIQEKRAFPQSIDIDDRHAGRFPRIRILRADAGSAILDHVANSICETGMTGFPIARQPLRMRNAIHRYITNIDLSPEDIRAVEESPFWSETVINHILLLRGLISGGILTFAFGQKRWRVDYGTDATRETKTRLAVPFRAKDNPTPRSEFSHPDVVILLTCLSYYYKGLDDDDIFVAFELLLRSDSADMEYQAWVDTAPSLPLPFRQLTGINIRDRVQCISEIFPPLRYAKGAVDYFLSHMVFAKECKEFPYKLSASGWDLGKTKVNPTTGFSGTNDSRYVLPFDIKQLDLPEQNHTNALVLKCLLRPENGIMLMPQQLTGATLESGSLLQMVAQMSSNTRVILDVGAQIIDLDNLQFATTWLNRYTEDDQIQAVVFFSDADELTVVDRSGKLEALQISPFANQLDQCLVFLDEAHTRGTDLRLPTNYQAAVTLGANLTKDKLVQACMRMRKLGQGQSVVFCVPREIERKIRTHKSPELAAMSEITVSDVLCWVISETWLDLRRTVPLWLTQGVQFYKQQALWNEDLHSDEQGTARAEWAKKFLEDEAQSLDFRYRPRDAYSDSSILLQRAGPMSSHFQRRCQEFGLTDFRATSLQEEQERELSPETEREQQVEPPPRVEPQKHTCHPDLRYYITHGEFPSDFSAFKPAFMALGNTSAAKHLDVRQFPNHIWVTEDFSRTVKATHGVDSFFDLFQRPIHWVLTSTSDKNIICRMVILSPYEAQELLPNIEAASSVTLHLYAPRTNLGFRSLDQLTLYNIPHKTNPAIVPRDMMVHLNLFAGQLYMSSFKEYVDICDRLGLAWSPAGDSVVLGPDGFIPPGVEGNELVNQSGFTTSPVKFLKVLITKIRRNCEAAEKTHMGKILDGVLLLENDFSNDS